MRNIIFLSLFTANAIFAQNKINYSLFNGKTTKVSYAQVANNQSFCSYLENDSSMDKDSLWDNFSTLELKKYTLIDSLKMVPIHKFSLESGQKQYAFLKYSVSGKNKQLEYLSKEFLRNNTNWLEYEPKTSTEKDLAYLFKNIKTDVFQKLFARENDPTLLQINSIKKKVLNEDGFVNFDELVRQLKLLQQNDLAKFKTLCD